MTRITILAAAVALIAAGAANAGGWRKVATANDSSEFLAIAFLTKSAKRVHAAKIVVATSARAKISGTVSCIKGYDFNSKTFAYKSYGGGRVLRGVGGDCSFGVTGELKNGGSVRITLFVR